VGAECALIGVALVRSWAPCKDGLPSDEADISHGMRDPRRLEVVEVAAALAELTYQATRAFPSEERFGLVVQMRRAAVSVGSTITEGCGCSTNPAFLRYLQMAIGSALELDYQAMLAGRLGMGDPSLLGEVREHSLRTVKMLSRLSSAVRRRSPASRTP
jgi:four helix bundle protein